MADWLIGWPLFSRTLATADFAGETGDYCVTLDQPLQLNARYFTRLTATNRALPGLVRVVRSPGFYVDNTPSSEGTVLLRPVLPPRFHKQADFPQSVQGVRLRLRVADFVDYESGVMEYYVHLFMRSKLGLEVYLLSERFDAFQQDSFRTQTLPGAIAHNTTFFVRVNAINGAGVAGENNVTSDDAVLLLSRYYLLADY